tara:strand:- start:805 stop:1575 length:771 start_codon:yes stop_codon:yes gene_type:complete
MVNAWSLAYDVLNGTMDETYPIKKDKMTDDIKIETSKDEGVVNVPNGDVNLDNDITISTDIKHSDAWYDYNRNDPDRENPFTDAFDYMMGEAVVGGGNTASLDNSNSYCLDDGYPSAFTTFSDNDDQVAHLFADSLTLNIEGPTEDNMTDSRNKYHENEILEDIKAYVSGTYNGHYTGNKHEFRNVQTIDLMASRDLASDFCQANILKYGSRYGSKDGRNKKDLLKVIHYAMLLLHFDEHYGKPSMTSGNIDHNMP